MKRVTVAIPSYNQGRFIEDTIRSVLDQKSVSQICLADGGSTDNTLDILKRYEERFHWWRSGRDGGQSEAINLAVSKGDAEYVCWINSDDCYVPGGLDALAQYLDDHPDVPAVYGDCWHTNSNGNRTTKHNTQAFSATSLARRCYISQPSTLMRRDVWEALDGVSDDLHMVMDYDLWWRIYLEFGEMHYVPVDVSEARLHGETKTSRLRKQHYAEAMAIIKKYNGRIPLVWYLKYPWSVWYKASRLRFNKTS